MNAAMVKWVTSLILLIGLIMVACASGNQVDLPRTPDRPPPSPVIDEVGPPTLTSIPGPTSSIADAPQVVIKTDKDLYRQGESLLISIENHSSSPLQFIEFCSLHLCIQAGGDWICEEHECDGPMIRLESGSKLEFLEEARSLLPDNNAELISRYKLDYQLVSEDPYYFAYSNEFSIH
jgi:hypothetical protein